MGCDGDAWRAPRLSDTGRRAYRLRLGVHFEKPGNHEAMDDDWDVSPVTRKNKARARSQLGFPPASRLLSLSIGRLHPTSDEPVRRRPPSVEKAMFDVTFDRIIRTSLPQEELWRLIKGAFEDPSRSPIWPVELDEVHPVELQKGAQVTAAYKIGPLKAEPSYEITEFNRGRSFSYESDPDHPLAGGATVEVLPEDTGSALRWRGAYRPRRHLLAPGAILFVRLYFLRTFFSRLESNLLRYEEKIKSPRQSVRE